MYIQNYGIIICHENKIIEVAREYKSECANTHVKTQSLKPPFPVKSSEMNPIKGHALFIGMFYALLNFSRYITTSEIDYVVAAFIDIQEGKHNSSLQIRKITRIFLNNAVKLD